MQMLDFLLIISPLTTAAITLALGFFTLWKNREELISKVFAFWMFVSGLNALLFFAMQFLYMPDIIKIGNLIGALDPIIAIHFGVLFTSKRYRTMIDEELKGEGFERSPAARRYHMYFYVPWIFVLMAALITEIRLFLTIVTYYNAILYAALTYILVLVYLNYRRSQDQSAARSMVVFIGLFFIYVNAFLQITTGLIHQFITYAYIAQLILVPLSSIIFAYAVLKMDLLGTQIILKKSVAYTFASVITIAIFVILQEGLEDIIEATLLGDIPLAGIIAALGAVTLFSPVERFSKKMANRIFPKVLMDDETKMRIEAYRAAVEAAWADGNITRKERKMLEILKDSLEIPEEIHEEIWDDSLKTKEKD